MKITDIMTTDVTTCKPDITIRELASKMMELDVGSIPISDGERLLGIVTDRDIVIRGIAAQVSLDRPVSQILTSHLVTGTTDMSIKDAAEIMSKHQIRRLPIVQNDQLIGIVSLGDIAVRDRTDDNASMILEEVSESDNTRLQ
ncbi:CBS domain-containing protein [Planomicrobium stackebrandtii]|uniref:CBS domain-containing protein n=1 Tax=Planomicrobium stackebrandtii TaxID=253160 RepID=A0ABU0GQL4_9BACL|nr:CBS domain-containing protein [Planomicrobium stackebrandtii]MDQ0427358.1 CBS domain-containing protein [Planomicrobium stackebrandtii]